MQGLTQAEADRRLKEYGQNELTDSKRKSFLAILLSKFNNVLTLLLASAAGISFFIGESLEGVLIILIVILNALFSVYQEKKATDAVALLKNLSVTVARVIRDGQERQVDSRYLVPGDIVYVEEGSKIVADGKLIEAKNLEINESVLTGESLPVPKEPNEEVFMGTVVAKGRGYLEVVATGMKTKFGDITKHLTTVKKVATPLEKKLNSVSKKIGYIGIVVSIFVFGLSLYLGSSLTLAFLTGISLAVAVVPEGLPAVLTITLGLGVKEMAKKKAIVRKLSAIEAIGNVTLIATDKTGTLTTGNMSVKEVYVDGKVYHDERPHINNHPYSKLLLNSMLNSTASLVPVHGKDKLDVLGDTTEGALLMLTHEMKLSFEIARQEWKLLDELPFDGVTKRMSVIAAKAGESYLFSKGAPESIMEVCTTMAIGEKKEPFTDVEKEETRKSMNMWAKKGYRVMGFSYKEVPPNESKPITEQVAGMTFLGLVALYDPPRPEVRLALTNAMHAGIKVVMITGDNPTTAETIATEIGLMKRGEEVLTGKQLDDYTDEELMEHLPKTRIFARTTPFHKSRIVSLYQKLGEVVAVTGDGVNDAIALKQADIGIAMGLDGTDVARDTADIVLADDNFASIVDAVQEGRRIMKNFTNSLVYLTTGNFSEALTLVGGLLLGIHDLFFPIQLLYINLMSDGLPALTLAFAPIRERLMKAPPQREIKLYDAYAKRFIIMMGCLIAAVILGTYFILVEHVGVPIAKTGAFIQMDIAQVFMFVGLWSAHRMFKSFKQYMVPIFLFGFFTPIVVQFIINEIPWLTNAFHIEQVTYPVFFLFVGISTLPILIYSVTVYIADGIKHPAK